MPASAVSPSSEEITVSTETGGVLYSSATNAEKDASELSRTSTRIRTRCAAPRAISAEP